MSSFKITMSSSVPQSGTDDPVGPMDYFFGYNDSRKVLFQSVDDSLDFWHPGL